jgi:hypothetical protein
MTPHRSGCGNCLAFVLPARVGERDRIRDRSPPRLLCDTGDQPAEDDAAWVWSVFLMVAE